MPRKGRRRSVFGTRLGSRRLRASETPFLGIFFLAYSFCSTGVVFVLCEVMRYDEKHGGAEDYL
jgi:hypothetical protein